jgi:hypothetical protein
MKPRKYHTITAIVATVYCEQKAVYDQELGDARPLSIRAKAFGGTIEHLRFQAEGQTRQAIDKRCFIASQIYGIDAEETGWLRAWRDRFLVPRRVGRIAVAAYYRVGPMLIPALAGSRLLTHLVRAGLDRVVRLIGRTE